MATASSFNLYENLRSEIDQLQAKRDLETADLARQLGEARAELVAISADRDRLKASLLDREQQDARLHTQLGRVTHGGALRVFELASDANELRRLLDEGGGDTQLADALKDMLASSDFAEADKRLRFWQTGVEE